MACTIVKDGNKVFLQINGNLFYKHSSNRKNDEIQYWRCRQCDVRAVTKLCENRKPQLKKGIVYDCFEKKYLKFKFLTVFFVYLATAPREHSHAPMITKIKATKIVGNLKKRAIENPELLPAQILKDLNPETVPLEVAAHLPDIQNIKQTISRHRSKALPKNPRNIEELEYIPRKYSVTKSGELFLLYDSQNDEEDELDCGRIIIFSTEANLRMLFRCKSWSADGTFKCSPSIFYQLFTIMGAVTYNRNNKEKTVFLPFVYALMETKSEQAYSKVLDVIVHEAQQFEIHMVFPESIITDFELAIINALRAHFGDIVKACFFHLRQIVHRQIQQEGLQTAYADEDDDSVRNAAHMLCAIAFVPLDFVEPAFDLVVATVPGRFTVITDFFEVRNIENTL